MSVANDDDDDDDLDGIETVVLEENNTTTETDADAKTTGKMMFTEEGQPFESNNNTNAFDDGVQAASLGSQFAFALAVVLLLVITGGTLYVSSQRRAMDRKRRIRRSRGNGTTRKNSRSEQRKITARRE